MNKELSGHSCNACNKTFRKSSDLHKHMDAKHSENLCNYCDTVCDNEAAQIKHHTECIDLGVITVSCKKCQNKFTKSAMRRHKEVCQGNQECDCPECGMVFTNTVAVKKHYDEKHKLQPFQSREVCYHWRRGNCTRINCRYAHVGNQINTESASTKKTPQGFQHVKMELHVIGSKRVTVAIFTSG